MHGFAFDCIALAVIAAPGAAWLLGMFVASRHAEPPAASAVADAIEREHHIARHRRTIAQRQETAAVADLGTWRQARAQASPRTPPISRKEPHLMAVPEPEPDIFENAKDLARARRHLSPCGSRCFAADYLCDLTYGHVGDHQHQTREGELLRWSEPPARIGDIDADYAAARDGLNPSWPGWRGMGDRP